MEQLEKCMWCNNSNLKYIGDRSDGTMLFECPQCGLIMRDGAIYDDTYYKEDYYVDDADIIEKQNMRYQLMQYVIQDLSERNVLDIGCGLGYYLEKVSSLCKHACGVELSAWATKCCRRKGLDVYNSSIEDFNTNQTFDLITAWEVIEHVGDLKSFLYSIKRLLSKKGIFMISTPNAGSYRARKQGLQWNGFKWSPEHVYYFTATALNNLLKEVFINSRIRFVEFDWRSEDSLVAIVECSDEDFMSKRDDLKKVLFIGRTNGLTVPGGDMIQLFKTRRALEKNEINIDVSLCALPAVHNNLKYDLIHQFGLANAESVDQLYHLRFDLYRTLFSPIYWNLDEVKKSSAVLHEVFRQGRKEGNVDELLELFAVGKVMLDREQSYDTPYERLQKERKGLLNGIAHFLPNSFAEMEGLRKDFGLYRANYTVVPNAVDVELFAEASPMPFVEKYGLKDFILCAARLEPGKNQLMLIMAAKKMGLPLVLIGKPQVPEYVELCKYYAGPNVYFIEHIPQDLLASAYAAARVHALISWCETTGLSSLEAGFTGCNIVVSDRGPTWEYFGELAYYCDPGNIDSIVEAIAEAWEENDTNKKYLLKQRILGNYTWDRAADRTLEAYGKVIAQLNKGIMTKDTYILKTENEKLSVSLSAKGINKIAIFGAALTGERCLKAALDAGMEVEFFIDNSPARQGTLFMGLPVYPAEYVVLNNEAAEVDAIVLASAGYQSEMKNQLDNLGWRKLVIPANKFLIKL